MTSKADEMKERRALAGSTTDVTTYHQLHNLDTSLGGRFSVGGEVTGSSPITRYPAASAPWSGPQVGLEEPLGYSVEDQEPTGTFEEIQASRASGASRLSSFPDDATGEAPATPQSARELLELLFSKPGKDRR